MPMNYKIGLYGTDAQTDLILVNPAGKICAHRTAIGVNPDTTLDQDTIRSVLLEKLGELAAHAKSEHADAVIAHTALCLPGTLKFWEGIVARLHQFSPASAHQNFVPALEQATKGKPGLLIDCGELRSLVAARDADGKVHYAGNLGCRLNDPGSNYDIGCQALTCTLAELQGWSEPSDLGRAICDVMKLSDPVLLSTKLDGVAISHQQIADLTGLVIDLASKGDDVAATVIHNSVSEIADLAHTVRESLFGDSANVPVGLRGRILQSTPIRETLKELLGPKTKFVAITEAPTEGLRQLLLRIA
jgi:N-acetylglucosamine kinase-like BadF-type ATPase